MADLLDSAGRPMNSNGWRPPNGAAQQFAPQVQAYRPPNTPEVPTVSTHQVQADDEVAHQGDVVVDGDKVRFFDRYFRISERVGLMPLLRFAHSARGGVDSTDPRALVALYEMIADCVDQTRPQEVILHPVTKQPVIDEETGLAKTQDAGESEWDRFQDYATEVKADDEDLMDFVGQVIEVLSARPKQPRGNSRGGRALTSGNSKAASPSPVTAPAPAGPVPSEMDGLVSVDSLVPGRS